MASSCVTAKNFRGVRLRKWGRWGAEIRIPNSSKKIWLGAFSSSREAARAYDAALYCLRGPHSHFNFPDSPPIINNVPHSRDAIIRISRSYAMQFQLENHEGDVSSAAPESSVAVNYCCVQQKKPAVAVADASADANELSLCCEVCSLSSFMGSEYVTYHTVLHPLLWPELQQEEDPLAVVGEPDSFQNIWGFAEF